jgi:hypothetical protein
MKPKKLFTKFPWPTKRIIEFDLSLRAFLELQRKLSSVKRFKEGDSISLVDGTGETKLLFNILKTKK